MLVIHIYPSQNLKNDSESVWVKVFANKTSHFEASRYQPPGRNLVELTSEIELLRSQLQKIKSMHNGTPPIVWPDRLNKSESPLSPSKGERLIDIINDYGLEQLVHFPTRERNTLDLIIISLPGQFVDIHSPTDSVIMSFYPPQTVFVGGYTVFTLSESPSVRPTDRVSETFCFLDILKNH